LPLHICMIIFISVTGIREFHAWEDGAVWNKGVEGGDDVIMIRKIRVEMWQ
jgi:hypothetical protein